MANPNDVLSAIVQDDPRNSQANNLFNNKEFDRFTMKDYKNYNNELANVLHRMESFKDMAGGYTQFPNEPDSLRRAQMVTEGGGIDAKGMLSENVQAMELLKNKFGLNEEEVNNYLNSRMTTAVGESQAKAKSGKWYNKLLNRHQVEETPYREYNDEGMPTMYKPGKWSEGDQSMIKALFDKATYNNMAR